MACVKHLEGDERGVVYVEFLVAFMPIFLLFLGICQLSLVTIAQMLVQHSASMSVRTAIVVLEEDPAEYDGAPRGSLTEGEPDSETHWFTLVKKLKEWEGDSGGAVGQAVNSLTSGISQMGLNSDEGSEESSGATDNDNPQQGARMRPIRNAAYLPLLSLAPSRDAVEKTANIRAGVKAGWIDDIEFSTAYTEAAASVSLQDEAGSDELVAEPIDHAAPITVRVAYLYHCTIPVVRTMMCKKLTDILGTDADSERLNLPTTEAPGELRKSTKESARYLLLQGEATLPNQGAFYYRKKGSDEESPQEQGDDEE